jgi:hypothetical protein
MEKRILLVSILLSTLFIQNANAIPEKKFKNCTALNKVYPGGVAKQQYLINENRGTRIPPKVSSKVYKENKGLDRDKDGIACES